jgi:hypothetical protein
MPTEAAKDAHASPAAAEVAATDDLETARKAVEDTAAIGGGLWLSYLFVLFYVGIAAGAVTHADLLLQAPVKLPFLNIELPLLAFFFLAPLLLLLTHAYTLVHLVLLARRVEQFNAIKGLPEAWRRRRLPSNIFVQFLGAPEQDRYGPFGLLLGAILWVTLVVAPIALYLLLEIQFLPYHSRWITWTSRLALILDLGLLWWLWRTILASRARRRRARAWKTVAKMTAGALLTPLVVLFAWGVVTFPGEWQEKYVTVPWLFSGDVDPVLRRPKSYFANTLILPEFNLYAALKIDDPKKVEWKEHLIDLYDRDLTQAVLSRAILTKADLRYAQLQGALLFGAQLQGASLDRAQLQGASLIGAALQGASLFEARLQGAWLNFAQLQGASLGFAQLQGASLIEAQLQGGSVLSAGLWRAQLHHSVAKDLFVPAGSPDWSPKVFGAAWTDAAYAALRHSIEQAVPEGQNRDRALEQVTILDCAQQKRGDTALGSCDPAADPPDTVNQWKKMIEAATVDQGVYAKALAAILGGLVCSNEPDRIYVLRGL